MPAERGQPMELRNETAVNVAGLLKSLTGATRTYALHLDAFPLGDGLVAEDVDGEVRLTRLRDAVIAHVAVRGVTPLQCVRCLREYDQEFETEFGEEYRQSVDLRTGVEIPPEEDEDEDTFLIDENHELDLNEALRQEILVALPMRPDCGPSCPGPDVLEVGEAGDGPADSRFSALAGLLDEETTEAGS